MPVVSTTRVQPGRPHGSSQRSELCLIPFSHLRAGGLGQEAFEELAGVGTEGWWSDPARWRSAFFICLSLFKMLLGLQNDGKESPGSCCTPCTPTTSSVSLTSGVSGTLETVSEPITIRRDELKSLLHGDSLAFLSVPFPGSSLRCPIVFSHHCLSRFLMVVTVLSLPLHRGPSQFGGLLIRHIV